MKEVIAMKNRNSYNEMKKRHSEEFNKFPIKFAFSDQQFKEGMKQLGLTENDTDKVVSISSGGFIRKTDIEAFYEMSKRFVEEKQQAIKDDKTGEGYIRDMFESELANHEFGYTYDLTDTLEALGLTIEEINSNKNLKNGLNLALEKYREKDEDEEEMD